MWDLKTLEVMNSPEEHEKIQKLAYAFNGKPGSNVKYKIMGTYRGKTECVDTCDNEKDAIHLRTEYSIAFGSDWAIESIRDTSDD